MNENDANRKGLYITAIIAAFILFSSGVLSGLYAKGIILEETEKGLSELKADTEQEIETLSSYIEFLQANLQRTQLETTFTDSLNETQRCSYAQISQDALAERIKYYWDKLPYRIEEYEQQNEVTAEYLQLKNEYMQLSIQMWILAKEQSAKCKSNLVHGLMFYSKDCPECVRQGEEIDSLKAEIESRDKNLILFPIDFDTDEQVIRNIKTFYGINSTPAVVLNDRVFQGRRFTSDELVKSTEK